MTVLSLKEVDDEFCLKNEATTSVKLKAIFNEPNILAVIKMRDDAFINYSGIVTLQPTEGTHWVMFADEFYFDSHGCQHPITVVYQNF